MRYKVAIIALVILTAIFLLLFSIERYYVLQSTDGVILADDRSAYVFIQTGRRGYSTNLLNYPLLMLKRYLWAPPPPDNERFLLTVIRITDQGVQSKTIETGREAGMQPSLYTPLGGEVYANCLGRLCSWAGDHFAETTPRQERDFGGMNHLIADKDTQVNGWSKRVFGLAPVDYRWTVNVDGDLVISVKNTGKDQVPGKTLALDLQRSNLPSERLWSVNDRPRPVTKSEYQGEFEDRK